MNRVKDWEAQSGSEMVSIFSFRVNISQKFEGLFKKVEIKCQEKNFFCFSECLRVFIFRYYIWKR
jgi:hypothetical protein